MPPKRRVGRSPKLGPQPPPTRPVPLASITESGARDEGPRGAAPIFVPVQRESPHHVAPKAPAAPFPPCWCGTLLLGGASLTATTFLPGRSGQKLGLATGHSGVQSVPAAASAAALSVASLVSKQRTALQSYLAYLRQRPPVKLQIPPWAATVTTARTVHISGTHALLLAGGLGVGVGCAAVYASFKLYCSWSHGRSTPGAIYPPTTSAQHSVAAAASAVGAIGDSLDAAIALDTAAASFPPSPRASSTAVAASCGKPPSSPRKLRKQQEEGLQQQGGIRPQQYIDERAGVTWQSAAEEAAAFQALRSKVDSQLLLPLHQEQEQEQEGEGEGEVGAGSVSARGARAASFLSDGCLMRYLRASKGQAGTAYSMLEESLAWREAARPEALDCPLCCARAGCHTFRQVGFDNRARPVVYSCPGQEPPGTKLTPEDSNMHMVFALEEAAHTMVRGVEQWTWVLDMSGFSFRHADPRFAQHMGPLFAQHYPERLGCALVLNAPRIFSGLWAWVKRFVDPNTVAKIQFVSTCGTGGTGTGGGGDELRALLQRHFPPEMAVWLEAEVCANAGSGGGYYGRSKLSPTQQQWWLAPATTTTATATTTVSSPSSSSRSGGSSSGRGGTGGSATAAAAAVHDPRGCPSYVKEFLDPARPPLLPTAAAAMGAGPPQSTDEGEAEGPEQPPPEQEEEQEGERRRRRRHRPHPSIRRAVWGEERFVQASPPPMATMLCGNGGDPSSSSKRA